MSLNAFDRNYGMSLNGREYWGGDNGFVTVLVSLPADTEIGVTTVAQDGTDAAQTALSCAERNQFKIGQALAQRAVLVTTSALDTEFTVPADVEKVEGNTIAYGVVGTLDPKVFGITFIIERQDVFTKQEKKPGATYALTVDPTTEIAEVISKAGFFQKKDGTPADAVKGIAIKVLKALPVLA